MQHTCDIRNRYVKMLLIKCLKKTAFVKHNCMWKDKDLYVTGMTQPTLSEEVVQTQVAQNSDKQWTVVNTAIKFTVP